MTKQEALAMLKLLSALESWCLGHGKPMPDYLVEDLIKSMDILEREILK